ncbi:uncharacterized protein LOC130047581 [Ostrea edulis]|uniref:uncharacterized protein LOC130047581 n=1 Tax=Ostrea edulis TaxID=37623 RepID=UPI0024AFF184|nr:uncharacterized protein LOC130047581 [Ostrea edulis]
MNSKEDSNTNFTEVRRLRTTHQSQLTKLYNDIEKKLVTYDNVDIVKTSAKKVHERFHSFQEAHLQCLDKCSDSQMTETLENNFDSCKRNYEEFCERISQWLNQISDIVTLNEHRSEVGSSKNKSSETREIDNMSSVSATPSARSSRSRFRDARVKRLKAEQQIIALARKQELERARREIEDKEKIIEQQAELEIARLEESVWQEAVIEDEGETQEVSESMTHQRTEDRRNVRCIPPYATEPEVGNSMSMMNTVTQTGTQGSSHDIQDQGNQMKGPGVSSTTIDVAFSRLASVLQEGFNLPKPEILSFDGSPMNYTKFIKNFETNIENKINDNSTRLSYLIQYCKGEAKSSIEDCVLLEPTEGYKRAREILYSRYGRSHVIVRSYIDKLVYGDQIKASDVEELSRLALEMQKCEITLSQLGFRSDIGNSDNLRRIVKRIPMHLRTKWVDIAHSITESGREPRFSDLVKFVDDKSRVANSMYGLDLTREIKSHVKPNQCLQKLMFIISCIVVIIPWIFRIAIFYRYDDSEHDDKDDAARDRKLTLHFAYFPGSMLSFLTPVHGVFVFCYAILVADSVLFGLLELISSELKRNIEIVLRKCFRDMHESSYSRSFGWAIRTLLYPFKEYGVFAFFIVGIYWLFVLPVIIIGLAFYCVPTLNIVLRLLCHLIIVVFPNFKFVSRLKEKISVVGLLRRETIARLSTKSSGGFRTVQLVTILLSILALMSCVILVVEVIVFFVEMIVYTLIGVILNASQTLKYISLFFMLSLYARDCFGSVTQKYQAFNQAIHKALLGRAKEQVDKVAWQTEDRQPNTAFQISVDDHNDQVILMDSFPHMCSGVLKWSVPRVLLFLDNRDKPYITRTFFFKSAYIDHVGCPGSLYKNLVSALRQFLTIIIFLLFVIIVVMAFGNDYSVSGVNQMLATLAGGFLPWVFRNVLFKPPADVEVDTSSLSFQNLFDNVIKNYRQNWPVADIIADSKQPESQDVETMVNSSAEGSSPCEETGSVTKLNEVRERRNNILIVNMSTRVKSERDITDV